MTSTAAREAVGVFHDEKALQTAIDELMVSGFDRSHVSLVAGHRAIEEKLGHMYRKVAAIEDDPTVPKLAYVDADSRHEAEIGIIGGLAYVGALAAAGAIVASGGALAVTLIGAAAAGGTGGLVGAALARLVAKHHADYLGEQLDRGGLLLWVQTPDAEHEERATTVLKACGADDVHVHDLAEIDLDTDSGLSFDLSFMKKLGM
jgi:hypothetical protein